MLMKVKELETFRHKAFSYFMHRLKAPGLVSRGTYQ